MLVDPKNTVTSICRDPENPLNVRQVQNWIYRDKDFRDKYREVKRAASELAIDEVLAEASNRRDDKVEGANGMTGNATAVGRSKLIIDTAFRLAEKMLPKVYGQQSTLNVNADTPQVNAMVPKKNPVINPARIEDDEPSV